MPVVGGGDNLMAAHVSLQPGIWSFGSRRDKKKTLHGTIN